MNYFSITELYTGLVKVCSIIISDRSHMMENYYILVTKISTDAKKLYCNECLIVRFFFFICSALCLLITLQYQK